MNKPKPLLFTCLDFYPNSLMALTQPKPEISIWIHPKPPQTTTTTTSFAPFNNKTKRSSLPLHLTKRSRWYVLRGNACDESRVERAWVHWNKLDRPKLIDAPMVDNSELPFRVLSRKYGAQVAYTPMLHSRIFTENEKYHNQEFTTCKEDRPLFFQFCVNDPDVLLEAARRVEPYCDCVDINLGCPQRIARRRNYGAFLMHNLPIMKSLMEKLALNLNVPVSCKIRVFPNLQKTIKYAKMLEDAGCSLLADHGQTRDEKDGKKFQADWNAIKAVENALRIPVLANGNIRHMDDVHNSLKVTGVNGVLSAKSLIENPALFSGF